MFKLKLMEQAIRERACHMWLEAGRPEGNAAGDCRPTRGLVASLGSVALVTAAVEKKPVRKAKAVASSKKRRPA